MRELLSRFHPDTARRFSKRLAPRVALTTFLLTAPLSTPEAKAKSDFSHYGVRQGIEKVGVVVLDLDGNQNPGMMTYTQKILEEKGRHPYSVAEYFEEAMPNLPYDFAFVGQYSVSAPTCNQRAIAEAGQTVFMQNGGDPESFNAMMYITEDKPPGGCSHGGAYVKAFNTVVINGDLKLALIVQELLHARGLGGHAEGYDCDDLPRTIENCAVSYGDKTDPMGMAIKENMYYNLNFPHKLAVGVLTDQKVRTIKDSGNYSLTGSETDGKGSKGLKIKANSQEYGENSYFFLEYRQPLPDFKDTFPSAFAVTAWNGDKDSPTYYVGSLNCRRNACDSLTLRGDNTIIVITALSEDRDKGRVRIEINGYG